MEGWTGRRLSQRTENISWDTETFQIGTPLALGAALGAKSHTGSKQPVRLKALDRTESAELCERQGRLQQHGGRAGQGAEAEGGEGSVRWPQPDMVDPPRPAG